ncbi:MAG: tetraacyldisaccharide 4'-kinase [Bernardetiaceae bacterium]|nr:tetraacyldisaccharide 4'-kinase [Bernardetiaceae bacterium]
MQFLLQFFLKIASLLFGIVIKLRNDAYDKKFFKAVRPKSVAISVGNLNVGGTGKTPHIEYLIRLFVASHSIATLSRGYGRKTKGFRIAQISDNAQSIGDEPMQFFQKFAPQVAVCVGEKRVEAAEQIQKERPETNLLLLDDAFQHRAIAPHIQILLCDYNRPFYQDALLPFGRLREHPRGAKRADAIIVSKTPTGISEHEKQDIVNNLKRYTKSETPIFFSSIRYATPIPLFHTNQKQPHTRHVLGVSGIAQPKVFERALAQRFELIEAIAFPDHRDYNLADYEKIRKKWQSIQSSFDKISIIITEKDAVKWRNQKAILGELPIFYLPIEVYVQPHPQLHFDTWLAEQVAKNKK